MTTNDIKQKLLAGFSNANITIDGNGCNCSVLIISDEFSDMSLLDRQKKILDLVNDEITSGELHALTIKARTKDEM